MSALQPNLMTANSAHPYWFNAFVIGTVITLLLFMTLQNLGKSFVLTDPPVIVVDFMQWQEPAKQKVAVKNRPVKQKPKTVRKEKPVIKKTIKPVKPKTIQNKQAVVNKQQSEPLAAPVISESPAEQISQPVIPQKQQEQFEESLPVPLPVYKATSLPRIAHSANAEDYYPPVKRQQGIEATVKVEILIDRFGKVRSVKILKSAGVVFDQAAIDYIKASSFIPANFSGRPGPILWRQDVPFRLK